MSTPLEPDELVASFYNLSRDAQEIISKLVEYGTQDKVVNFVLTGDGGSYAIDSIPRQIATMQSQFNTLTESFVTDYWGTSIQSQTLRWSNGKMAGLDTVLASGYTVIYDYTRNATTGLLEQIDITVKNPSDVVIQTSTFDVTWQNGVISSITPGV